jgi:gliding motility-associated-like protein
MKKVAIIFFALFISFISEAQTFSAGPDQTICTGLNTTLQGTGPLSYTYLWTSAPDDPTISDPTSLTPTVQPTQNTTYTLEGRSVSIVNSVVNGNFETGDNTGFTSSYTYMPGSNGSIYNHGTYAITTNAANNHPNFTCDADHTTGNGYFMAVNGSNVQNTVVWEQTINVDPNTDYEFSTWVMSLDPDNPAILQFSINGVLLGTSFQATSTTCVWNMFFEEWNSGSESIATISIVNQNIQQNGNDFALDDIRFAEVSFYYDECDVTVNDVPTSDFDIAAQSCSSDTVIVTYTGTASPTAVFNWGFDNPTYQSGTGSGPYKLLWDVDGLKTVSLYVDDACLSTTTTHNIDILQSPVVNVSANPQTILYGTTTTLHGSMTGNSGQLVFDWDPDDSIQNPNHLHPQTKPLRATTLFTFTSSNLTNGCSASDTVTVFVTGGPLGITNLMASPDTICEGLSSDIAITVQGGSGVYTNTWSSNPPGYSYVGSDALITVTPSETTTYYVYSNDTISTTNIDSVKIVVLPQIELIENPSDTTIEINQSASFSVQGINVVNYQWQTSSDGGNTWNDITDNTTYSGTQTQTLTILSADGSIDGNLYRCVLTGDCDPVISEEGLLTVVNSPDIVGALYNATACQLDTIYVPCTLSNFNEIDSFNLVFNYDTSFLAYIRTEIYPPVLLTLSDNSLNDTISLNWYNNTGETINQDTIFEFVFVAKEGGEDSLTFNNNSTVRNSFGYYPYMHVSSANIVVTALPIQPDSAIVYPDSLNILDEIDIDLETMGGMGNYLIWTADSCNGDSIGSSANITILRPEQTTTYFVKWVNICGITECKSATIKINNLYNFSVPNAFTPNNDGINDKFGAIATGTLPVFDFFIFNRWGQMIFSSSDQYELWDGTYNGNECPTGVYIWKTRYQYRIEGIGSEVHEESGTVTLIR